MGGCVGVFSRILDVLNSYSSYDHTCIYTTDLTKDISQECTDQIGLRFSEHPPARRIYLCGHGGFLSGCITGLMGKSPAVVLGCGERMDSKWDRLKKMGKV